MELHVRRVMCFDRMFDGWWLRLRLLLDDLMRLKWVCDQIRASCNLTERGRATDRQEAWWVMKGRVVCLYLDCHPAYVNLSNHLITAKGWQNSDCNCCGSLQLQSLRFSPEKAFSQCQSQYRFYLPASFKATRVEPKCCTIKFKHAKSNKITSHKNSKTQWMELKGKT